MPNPEHVAELNDSIEVAQNEYDKYVGSDYGDLADIFTPNLIAYFVEDILESIELVKGTSKSERKNPTGGANTLFTKVYLRINNNDITFLTPDNSRMFKAYWHLISMHDLEIRNSRKTFAELMQAILDYND